ncbi:MAG TPA: anhydro-N-acetylmuramic acid kinase [Candidatus Solibacter sp.]|nr:anhydro-N-acetylmuramic acid kinase [Candidatus Solibacter sp.]
MIVAGVMSGTSADGINVALVRLEHSVQGARSKHRKLKFKLIGHTEYPYPARVRSAILAAMNATRVSVADLSRLNFLLGELYADAVRATCRRFHVKAQLVGCHGQTVYHQGEKQMFLGRRISATWQTGEAATIAARLGIPAVSDFRPADMAAGGKGAPLVPYLDYLLFSDAKVGRIVQNIGGIANLTAIPAGAAETKLLAFDSGPGNMVIDAVTDALYARPFDRDGRIASQGDILEDVLKQQLRHPFFRASPPKTAGREEFGREFAREFLRACRGTHKRDVVATATALTARSIAGAVRRFVLGSQSKRRSFHEMILSGGGARNSTLVGMLAESLAPLGIQLRFSNEFGLPSEAKEAVAFALLAYETWHRRPSNVPSATGATRPAVLGKISYV